jgi:uncharacterized protein involved in exopolysaccharide biosynthesis
MPSIRESGSPAPNTLLVVALRNWRVLIASAIVCAAIAALIVSWQPSLYESVTTLLVAQSDDAGSPPHTSGAANLRALLENGRTAAVVIEKLRLDKSPESLTPGKLVSERLRVVQLRDTAYLQVSLRMLSPSAARDTLAALIQGGTALNTRIETDGATLLTNELLIKRAEEAKRHLEKVDKEMLDLRRSVQVERLQAETEAAMRRQERVLELDAQIASEQTRLTQAEKELSARVRRESSPGTHGEASSSISPRLRNSSDPVYDALDYEVATSRMRVQALRTERSIVGKQSSNAPIVDLHDARARLERLELEQRRAFRVYSAAVERMDNARQLTEARNVRILVVDPPSLPEAPSAPRIWLSAALAGTLGLAGALFGLVAFAWRGATELRN